ncbi:histidine phosphatase family protein [Nocardioides jensenii]|uniref:histidine phosphatase family protein n=1 Tax=Nocardioides jensenii TaxID=1843 RepID=UPI00082ECF58|nr:histidine phosphatase family protein [Nocardioides jensenii]
MGQLLLVRHGQASWGTEDYDVLSPLGWEQSRMLGVALAARGLKPDVLVQGSMRRHRETAEATIEAAGWSGVDVVDDDGWNEFDHLGMLASVPSPEEGRDLTRAEFQTWFERATGRWTSGEFDGDYQESFPAFAARVDAALQRTMDRVGSSGTAVVFTSGGPVSLAASGLLATVAPDLTAASYAGIWGQLNKVVVNSSVTKVVVGGRGATLVSFNEHCHLEGDGLTYR